MQPLAHVLLQHGFSKLLAKPNLDLEALEHTLDFRLPEDYKYYLLNFTSFEDFIGPEYLSLWGAEELVQLNREYNIFENLPNTICIGSNMSSEFIAIEHTNNEIYQVVLSPLTVLNTHYHINIGDSFANFINRLDDGIGWFDSVE